MTDSTSPVGSLQSVVGNRAAPIHAPLMCETALRFPAFQKCVIADGDTHFFKATSNSRVTHYTLHSQNGVAGRPCTPADMLRISDYAYPFSKGTSSIFLRKSPLSSLRAALDKTDFCHGITPPKTGNRIFYPLSRFRPLHYTTKPAEWRLCLQTFDLFQRTRYTIIYLTSNHYRRL